MKKLALLLLTFVSLGTAAFAADVSVSGKLTTWAGMESNASDFNDDGSDSVGYLYVNGELNTAVELADNVKVVLELELNDKVSNGKSNRRVYDRSTKKLDAGDTTTATVEIDEAYVSVGEFLTDMLSLKIGHQYYENSLRANHRAMVLATDMTAFKGTFKFEKLSLDVFYGKVKETLTSVNASDDSDVYGVFADINVNENIRAIAYLNNTTMDNAGKDHGNIIAVGGGVDWFLLDKKLEVFGEIAAEFGDTSEDVSRSAFGLDIGAKYNFGELGSIKGLTVELNISYRTGEDDEADTDTEFFENNAQRTGALIAESNFNLSSTNSDNPMYKGYVQAGYTAIRLEVGAQWTDKIGSYLLLAHFTDNSDAVDEVIGTEVDLCTVYKHTENLSMGAHLGYFMPDDGITGGGNDDSVFAFALETTVAF